jgi:nucleotide-binding universal stress UspA family protein
VTAVTSQLDRSTERVAGPATGRVGAAGGQPAPDVARTLLLATDLSEASSSATEEAFELGALLHASLLIVSVIDPGSLQLPGGRFRARIDQVRAAREQQAQALVERGRDAGLEVSFLVWTGDPGSMIVEAAEAEGADMVLVGSHGRGAVGRFFLGSVSEHVVRHAPCPVLVVRPRERSPLP